MYDPWVLYSSGVLTNPNCLLAGVVGRGKSTLAKAIATRSIAFGRKCYVPGDPKGEWSIVAKSVGGQAIELGQSSARLNPLDEGPRTAFVTNPDGTQTSLTDDAWADMVRQRRRELLRSITEAALGRSMTRAQSSGRWRLGWVVRRSLHRWLRSEPADGESGPESHPGFGRQDRSGDGVREFVDGGCPCRPLGRPALGRLRRGVASVEAARATRADAESIQARSRSRHCEFDGDPPAQRPRLSGRGQLPGAQSRPGPAGGLFDQDHLRPGVGRGPKDRRGTGPLLD